MEELHRILAGQDTRATLQEAVSISVAEFKSFLKLRELMLNADIEVYDEDGRKVEFLAFGLKTIWRTHEDAVDALNAYLKVYRGSTPEDRQMFVLGKDAFKE